MTKLTEREYWEGLYAEDAHPGSAGPAVPVAAAPSRIKALLRRLLGRKLLQWSQPYDNYLLWEAILPRYLAGASGAKAIEIGSAPGSFMIRLADTFGVEPFGVDYTATGAAANRAAFAAQGYAVDNVIEADVFSPAFQSAYREQFDIVVSRGFIEHFTELEPVLDAHLNLLKPGGLLIVLIPNLRGIYWLWTWIFNRPQLPLHNLSIMRLQRFQSLFDASRIRAEECDYHGTFSFWLFTVEPPVRVMKIVMRLLILIQRGLNILFRGIFGKRGAESAYFSPNLLFIGRKSSAAR